MNSTTQGKFGTYAKFYEHFFVSNKEVIGCPKKLSNLLKNCLSPLVPYEPASVLRTHLSNQIQAPLNLRDVASDYYMLARTRLKDLKGEKDFFMLCIGKILFFPDLQARRNV